VNSGHRDLWPRCPLLTDIVEKLICCGGWLLLIHSLRMNREAPSMMGDRLIRQESLFYQFRLDDHVPTDHMLRAIDRFVDLDGLRRHLAPFPGQLLRWVAARDARLLQDPRAL
jgi:hypothetical protein